MFWIAGQGAGLAIAHEGALFSDVWLDGLAATLPPLLLAEHQVAGFVLEGLYIGRKLGEELLEVYVGDSFPWSEVEEAVQDWEEHCLP